MPFAIIVTSNEVLAHDKTVMTTKGEIFWVVRGDDGLPTGQHFHFERRVPQRLYVFETSDAAEAFGRHWKGHPWWVRPISCEVIEVEPIYKQVLDGYRLVDVPPQPDWL